MKLTVIGVGPGDPELLTVKAVKAIEKADVILVPVKKAGSTDSTALKISRSYIVDMSKVNYLHFPMINLEENKEIFDKAFKANADKVKAITKEGKNVVFLTLGDSMVYSTFSYISGYFDNISYIPGIPSFVHGACATGVPLAIGTSSFCIINMTDNEEHLEEAFKLHDRIVVMKISANPEKLRQLIDKYKKQAVIFTNLGSEGEVITDSLDYLQGKLPYFTTGIVYPCK